MKKQTVFVGLSGGVDSAVSAALLKKQNYDVVGVFIRTWHPDFLQCNEEEERRDAMRVAAHLDIPFLTFDFEDVYKKEVADYMIREYKTGRTPNPDVMCNKKVKFGAFLKKALSMGANYAATGHYAEVALVQDFLLRNVNHSQKQLLLRRGKDPSKDQSYFLWTLNQKQLSKILFPVGHLKKTEVRKLAKKFNLPVAEKKDSQGICFLGAVDLKKFLKHYIKEKRGKVLNEKREIIGWHSGAMFHTLGERHGFTITKKSPKDGPYYIVGKNVKKNILIVSKSRNLLEKSTDIFLLKNSSKLGAPASVASFQKDFYLGIRNTNWILARPSSGGSKSYPLKTKNYTAQIRYHGEFLSCQIKCTKSGFAQVIFKKPVLAASGQSCVIYDKDTCLGGGVIV